MKKLHSIAFYALLTPAITLGSGALLAAQDSETKDVGEQSMGEEVKSDQQGSQREQGATKSRYNSDSAAQADQKMGKQAGVQGKQYMESAPADSMAASDLIGTDLKTSDDESLGEIDDLIVGQDGKVVAVVVSVGEFLGIGEKQVAIDWNSVKMSGNADEGDLRVDMTRDDLESAPSYEKQAD